jgi:uridine phosphorylase
VSVDTGKYSHREYVVSVAFNRQHVIVVDHGLPEPSTSFFLTKLLHLAVPTFVINDGKII